MFFEHVISRIISCLSQKHTKLNKITDWLVKGLEIIAVKMFYAFKIFLTAKRCYALSTIAGGRTVTVGLKGKRLPANGKRGTTHDSYREGRK
jgi:hypothetical protein